MSIVYFENSQPDDKDSPYLLPSGLHAIPRIRNATSTVYFGYPFIISNHSLETYFLNISSLLLLFAHSGNHNTHRTNKSACLHPVTRGWLLPFVTTACRRTISLPRTRLSVNLIIRFRKTGRFTGLQPAPSFFPITAVHPH